MFTFSRREAIVVCAEIVCVGRTKLSEPGKDSIQAFVLAQRELSHSINLSPAGRADSRGVSTTNPSRIHFLLLEFGGHNDRWADFRQKTVCRSINITRASFVAPSKLWGEIPERCPGEA